MSETKAAGYLIAALDRLPQTRLLRASGLYRSAPWEASGPDFINAVAELHTALDAHALLSALHGLEQVHVLLRRVDDEFLDPLELRPDSQLGVPGLLQALRAGEVVMANAPGAGVLESPGLAAFWPGVAERLLGEDLQLPASTSWWCGEAAVWQQQRDNAKPKETFGRTPDETMEQPAYRRYMIDKIHRYHASYLGWIDNYNDSDRAVLEGAGELQKAFG